jgi:hypothetical protein
MAPVVVGARAAQAAILPAPPWAVPPAMVVRDWMDLVAAVAPAAAAG